MAALFAGTAMMAAGSLGTQTEQNFDGEVHRQFIWNISYSCHRRLMKILIAGGRLFYICMADRCVVMM